ncbi:MAG TPA: hypothetical protein PLZ50_10435, partial [Rubrivivax sp.]|nr:hypothetical protein [Rubrivivax sp.]
MRTADRGGAATPTATAPASGSGERLRTFLRIGAVPILLAAMLVGFSLAQPAFIDLANLMSIL